MHVAELWRYPVKSMRGESLERAIVRADGIVGDRLLLVRDADGELVTARTRPRLLTLAASAAADATARVDGRDWRHTAVTEAVRAASGDGARLEPAPPDERFDDTPLLIATDGAVAALGADRRRLRPNIVIEGVDGLAERDWPGRSLAIGTARLSVEKVCRRCVVTTIDPDTLATDANVLRDINERFDGRIALNCYVERPGEVSVGDAVELI